MSDTKSYPVGQFVVYTLTQADADAINAKRLVKAGDAALIIYTGSGYTPVLMRADHHAVTPSGEGRGKGQVYKYVPGDPAVPRLL